MSDCQPAQFYHLLYPPFSCAWATAVRWIVWSHSWSLGSSPPLIRMALGLSCSDRVPKGASPTFFFFLDSVFHSASNPSLKASSAKPLWKQASSYPKAWPQILCAATTFFNGRGLAEKHVNQKLIMKWSQPYEQILNGRPCFHSAWSLSPFLAKHEPLQQ